ncbi:hypothetical protein NIES2135_68090 (plasmid) [Leptolyngbya boryana NIES-2135]|jgi:hypothetical protein|uniref:Uncharacterized protein n=1 Tax=Leptolyngbya boryana NIES-2135 TaxID=1973484 RepID=A0A1Z4JT83_LEPBY|nr:MULTISPECIES: hypothetical protein [Leptolyngbya]BAY59932.1 hypothetical protein NIES2135_68090 [Leptolyngbya boryana NIES-2135]MBD2371511.1 hypothetical protein [Leptolyngbya sp. FACHB-161]MBD2378050.1 hypothetical protein [Leptolyngbya sp. FACHB-238]MBD2402495.1 hypothetical protein [Leptolyngbya sp. FACHB-239]MBD2408982.1 hypothetical protein [Leptolyngbya sp. FACHB-402]
MEAIHVIGAFVLLHHNMVMPVAVHMSPALESVLNVVNAGIETIFIPTMPLTLL